MLLKPDAVQRGLVGELIHRIERRGLKLVGMKMLQLDETLGTRHYEAHVGKPFFTGLIEFITSSPLVAMVVEGPEVVEAVRSLMGETDPLDSAPGTIRGDYALTIGQNLMHGSDSNESAQREIGIFFEPEEILGYERSIDCWVIES